MGQLVCSQLWQPLYHKGELDNEFVDAAPFIRLHQHVATFASMTSICFHSAQHSTCRIAMPRLIKRASLSQHAVQVSERSRACLFGDEGGRYVELQPVPPRPPLTTSTTSSAKALSRFSGSGHHPSTFKDLIQPFASNEKLCRALNDHNRRESMHLLLSARSRSWTSEATREQQRQRETSFSVV